MLKILVVDDESDYRTLISQLLMRGLEADVITATSKSEAVQMLDSEEWLDLVICDYQMPDGTGFDVFEHMKQAGNSSFFVLCTNMPVSVLPKFEGDGFLGIIQKAEIHKVCEKLSALLSSGSRKGWTV